MKESGSCCEHNFLVSCWYGEGDMLHISAAFVGEVNAQFAFYVFLDGDKVASRWYGPGRDVRIQLPENNAKNIKVTAFCKFESGKLKRTLSPSYVFGSIKSGCAVIAVCSSSPNEGKKLRFFDEVGSNILIEPAEVVNDFLGYIKKSGHKTPRGQYVEFFRANVVLSGCRKVYFTHRDFPDVALPWAKDRLSLEVLHTPSEELFKSRFTFASTRHYASEVILEISKNNLADPDLLDSIYINSSVVFIYKVLELEFFSINFERMGEVSKRAMSLVERVRHGGSVRSDKVQLVLSLLVARIHFLFLQRRYEDVIACAVLASKAVNAYGFRDSYSLNLSKANFFALVAAYLLKDYHAYGRFLQSVLETRALLDGFLRANKTEWLVAESRYVYALADLAAALKNEAHTEIKSLILAGLREASRVKTVDYLSAIEKLVQENE